MNDYEIVRQACIKSNSDLAKRHIWEDEEYDVICLTDVAKPTTRSARIPLILDSVDMADNIIGGRNALGIAAAPSVARP
jgi:hypothetical protein